jgi:metal-responsive CopG/Arc/MetJ family transcriptional regulator
MRKKLPIEEKKQSTTVTIDADLVELLDKYVELNQIKNKSKFIEELIIKELENKNLK